MSLYLKYRPTSLQQIQGNRTMIEALEGVLAYRDEIPHAILLTGPSGCGKTTIGRIIRDILQCGATDYTEVDSADFRGIDTVRDIRRRMHLKPMTGPVRVWLIDEVHKMTNDAQNAFLKALEDTPPHVYFILCTTDPQKLIKTIITRCMEFRVSALGERQMTHLLKQIAAAEGKQITDGAIIQIARGSLGSPRAAINALQKIIDLDPKQQERAVEKAMAEEVQSIELCRALIGGKGWDVVRDLLKGLQDQEAETVRRSVLGYCNSVLLTENNARAAMIIRELQYPTYDSGWPGLTGMCYMASEMSK